MRAWKAYVTACQGTLLIGGVKTHESHPFLYREDASTWIQTVLEVNYEARRAVSTWGTILVNYDNPI